MEKLFRNNFFSKIAFCFISAPSCGSAPPFWPLLKERLDCIEILTEKSSEQIVKNFVNEITIFHFGTPKWVSKSPVEGMFEMSC